MELTPSFYRPFVVVVRLKWDAVHLWENTVYTVNGTNVDRTSVRSCVLSIFIDLISYGQVQGLDIIIITQRDGPNSF